MPEIKTEMRFSEFIANRIFSIGCDGHNTVTRIAYKSGEYPDHEKELGGLCYKSFVNEIDKAMRDWLGF